MPDLLTHVLVGLILVKLFKVRKKSLVLLGAALPDIISKLPLWRFFPTSRNIFFFGLMPFHSLIGLIILTVLISFFFNYKEYKTITLISLGWISHIILDLTNKHYLIKQVYLLMPFSYKATEIGWLWQDEYLIMLLSSIVILITIYIIENVTKWRKIKKKHDKVKGIKTSLIS